MSNKPQAKRLGNTAWRKSQMQILLLLLPAILICLVFCYGPMLGIVIAFQKYNIVKGIFQSPFIGVENFARFFDSPYAWRVIRNTLLLNIYCIITSCPLSVAFALVLNEIRCAPFKRVSQTISYLPHFISTVVLVGMMKMIFSNDGVINSMLVSMGGDKIAFFSKTAWFRPLYVGSNLWSGIGWNSIIYLAALSGVDMALYEAADIDGATRLQKITHISLPSILPVVCTMLILVLSSVLNVGFEKVYLMYNPSVYETADVISTYLYRKSFEATAPEFGLSAAIGLISSIVGGVFVLGGNLTVKKLGGSSIL